MRTRGDVGVALSVAMMTMAICAVVGELGETVFAQGSAPGAFTKTSPTHNALGQSTTLLLEWTASTGAASYEYCLDTTLDNTCNAGWNSIPPSVGIVVESLAAGATYEWQVRANGGGTTEANAGAWFRFTTRVLPSGTYFLDDLETAGALGWGRQGTWDVTTEASHSPSHAWSDSPSGNYAADTESAITSPAIDLTGALLPRLTFWHRYAFAPDDDRGIVLVTTDDGTTYSQLRSFTGSDSTWRKVTIDLTPFAGASSLRVVFQVSSDGSPQGDGWYIDDIAVAELAPFADNPLISGVTPVRGLHVSELRVRIDALRVRSGLALFPWTDLIASGLTPIRAQHILDLRTALAAVYLNASLQPPTYTDPGLVPGVTPIKSVHIQELRDAVVAIE
jgi:hypothetical protein